MKRKRCWILAIKRRDPRAAISINQYKATLKDSRESSPKTPTQQGMLAREIQPEERARLLTTGLRGDYEFYTL
jgi:hypothetical protein